jgi:hypothetical protein
MVEVQKGQLLTYLTTVRVMLERPDAPFSHRAEASQSGVDSNIFIFLNGVIIKKRGCIWNIGK